MTVNTYLRRKIVDVLGEIVEGTASTVALKVGSEQYAVLPALRAMADEGLLRKSITRNQIPVWRLA